jgi:hypothetical protein
MSFGCFLALGLDGVMSFVQVLSGSISRLSGSKEAKADDLVLCTTTCRSCPALWDTSEAKKDTLSSGRSIGLNRDFGFPPERFFLSYAQAAGLSPLNR